MLPERADWGGELTLNSALPTTSTQTDPSAARTYAPDLSGHLPVLDAVRGVAILMVMLYHFELAATRATKYPHRFVQFGWCGVDLFFVLSGFLITGILLEAKHDAHYFRNFYARRVLRIFPLYYAVLGALAIAVALMAPHWPEVSAISRLQSWLWWYGANFKLAMDNSWMAFRGDPFDLGHLWSLAVEEHFYLVWPAVVLMLNRRALMRFCLAIMVVALATRIYCVASGNTIAAYVLTPCRMDGLAFGAWIALAARGPDGLRWVRRWAAPVAGITALALAAVYLGAGGMDYFHAPVATIGYTLLDLFFAAIIVLAISVDPATAAGQLLAARWLRSLGKYSYALYIFHMFFVYPVVNSGIHRYVHSTTLSIWMSIAIASVTAYALAWLSWYLFERHFLKLKRFFPHSTASSPLANQRAIRSFGAHATQIAAGDPVGR